MSTKKDTRNIFDIFAWRRFFISRRFMILTALMGALFVFFQAEVAGAAFFILLISLLLVVCDDILTTTLPFFVLCVSVLQCYDSFDTFIKFAYFAVIPVGAFIFHFVRYRQKFQAGKTLRGLLAVAVAVTVGGIGTISSKDYFSGGSLYYLVALGFGMVGVYLLIKSQIREREDYDIREKFVDIMYIMGIFTCFHMLELYYESVPSRLISFTGLAKNPINTTFTKVFRFVFLFEENLEIRCHLQPSNNICTFLMMAIPFPIYRALSGKSSKSKLHLLSVLLMAFCIFISKSRGGWLMGGILLLICCVFAAVYEKKALWKAAFIIIPIAVIGVALSWLSYYHNIKDVLYSLFDKGVLSSDEARVSLLRQSIEAFKENPIFGQGIGNRVNFDNGLYQGKSGTMIWYHMMIPQIYGSMGCVGIVAYAYQFLERLFLAFKKRSLYVMTLLLSYGGLFLMSQVNPGEFCPIPYGLTAVMLFIMMENEPDAKDKKLIK